MTHTTGHLSDTRLRRLRAQGYTCQTTEELNRLAFGIRFPFRMCFALLVVATLTQSITLFVFMMTVSLMGVLLPNHPFDYVYNLVVAPALDKPRVPARSASLRFTCGVATAWLAAIVFLLSTGSTAAGLAMAGILAALALLPSTIDFCVPTALYNALFARKRSFTFGEGCS